MSGTPVAQVIVDIQVRNVDRVFDYAVLPQHERHLRVGHRVLVPFGRRLVEGYVVAYPVQSALAELKPIAEILDTHPLLSETAIAISRWMSSRYFCVLAQSLQCWLPAGVRLRSSRRSVAKMETYYRPAATNRPEIGNSLAHAPSQRAALSLLLERGELSAGAAREAGLSAACKALVAKGLAVQLQRQVYRDPWQRRNWLKESHPLTGYQASALACIRNAMQGGGGRFLLHGVTGSGKTLVYLESIAAALQLGKTAIMLVPEISLTPQAVTAFKGWFGNRVAVLHSRLSASERADQWQAAAAGDVQVVLGARSAVFSPLANLGLIIIDEEHETAYKQEESPRYHAREVALERCAATGATLVLGSATPSLESFQQTLAGKAQLLELPERVDGKSLPMVDVIDMREELLAGNRSMFSRRLQAGLHHCLARNEQAILFLNRRGFASFMLCRTCGATIGCDHCRVTLTYHAPDQLLCHYCGVGRSVPATCPMCGSNYLRPFGAGTQRVEFEVQRLFPNARVMRMDMDTTARKGAHEAIWRSFVRGEADVLVGTQMVAKGLHFPGVTLVGVVCADTSLHFPDFRAAERTFQLLTQVAGRAGRGDEPGAVIVQTYAPQHYAVMAAATHNYAGFAEQELTFRRNAGYPPFTSLTRVLLCADSEEDVARNAHRLAAVCRHQGLEVVGPAPAPLYRLKDRYRWHMLLKGDDAVVRAAASDVQRAAAGISGQIIVDVNPYSLL